MFQFSQLGNVKTWMFELVTLWRMYHQILNTLYISLLFNLDFKPFYLNSTLLFSHLLSFTDNVTPYRSGCVTADILYFEDVL